MYLLDDKSSAIREVQRFLFVIGQRLDIPHLSIDGYYDEETFRAVRAFQSTYGLAEDGVVGETTWRELTDVYEGLVASVPLRFTEGVPLPFPGEALTLGSE